MNIVARKTILVAGALTTALAIGAVSGNAYGNHAARATFAARPTPTPHVIIRTRVVERTRTRTVPVVHTVTRTVTKTVPVVHTVTRTITRVVWKTIVVTATPPPSAAPSPVPTLNPAGDLGTGDWSFSVSPAGAYCAWDVMQDGAMHSSGMVVTTPVHLGQSTLVDMACGSATVGPEQPYTLVLQNAGVPVASDQGKDFAMLGSTDVAMCLVGNHMGLPYKQCS